MVWTAAVIGAGAIGAGLDDPDGAVRLTHAGGYASHPGFTLAALADLDIETAQAQARRWNCRAYNDPGRMLGEIRPDVVSICTATPGHEEMIELALTHGARAIVCEKPLCATLEASRRTADRALKAGVPVIVNYTRRFVPFYTELERRIREGKERPVSACFKYAKGINHNGSHALDLARFLFGEATLTQALYGRRDHFPDDPTVSAYLRFERCPEIFLQGLDERLFTFFEFDLTTDQGRYLVNEDGFTVSRFHVREHPHYHCRSLGLAERVDTGHGRAGYNLADHAAKVLSGESAPRCSALDAIRAQELAQELVHKLARQARGTSQ